MSNDSQFDTNHFTPHTCGCAAFRFLDAILVKTTPRLRPSAICSSTMTIHGVRCVQWMVRRGDGDAKSVCQRTDKRNQPFREYGAQSTRSMLIVVRSCRGKRSVVSSISSTMLRHEVVTIEIVVRSRLWRSQRPMVSSMPSAMLRF